MFEDARIQGRLRAAGYCSLCGIEKATTTIGNRQVCEVCKQTWGGSPAPDMWTVVAQERKANLAFLEMEKNSEPHRSRK